MRRFELLKTCSCVAALIAVALIVMPVSTVWAQEMPPMGACCCANGHCDYRWQLECLGFCAFYPLKKCSEIDCQPLPPPGGLSPQSVPAMNHWGLLAFGVLLIGAYTWIIKRRRGKRSS